MTAGRPFQAGAVIGALVLAAIASGCGGGGSKPSAAATGQVAAGAVSPVKATGGGTFCTQVADGINRAVSSAAAATYATTMRTTIEAARKKTADALNSAPGEIKPDLQVLVDASNKLYDALSQANYDYTKLPPTATAVMATPAVQAASTHVESYVKDKCGIDLAHQAGATAAESPTTKVDAAGSGSGTDASACNLISEAQATTAMKQAMKVSGGAGGAICTYSATADPSSTLAVQTFASPKDMATYTQLEPSGEHINGLGDDAFWNSTLDMVFVRKGDRAFAVVSPSLANLTGDPQASKSAMVDLATIVLSKF